MKNSFNFIKKSIFQSIFIGNILFVSLFIPTSINCMQLASGSEDGTVKIWNLATGKIIKSLSQILSQKKISWVLSVAFSPDGNTLVPTSSEGKIKIWNTHNWKCIKTLNHKGWVLSVAFSPDGKFLVSTSSEGKIKIWNTTNWEDSKTLTQEEGGWVRSVAFSPDGKFLASGSNSSIEIWNVNTWKCIKILTPEYNIYSVVFSPDGSTLVSSSDQGKIKIWDTNNWKLIKAFKGHNSTIYSVIFHQEGKIIASVARDDDYKANLYGHYTVKIWDTNNWKLIKTLTQNGDAYSVAFSPDGKKLASGFNPNVKIWDTSDWKLIKTFKGHKDMIKSIVFMPYSKKILSEKIIENQKNKTKHTLILK